MIPSDLRYTKEHEWVRVEGDVATVGITQHAADQLGDIVFVELPEPGKRLEQFATATGNLQPVITSPVGAQVSGIVWKLHADYNSKVKAGDQVAVVESVKAVSDLFAPVAGEVLEGNAGLATTPEIVNSDPYGAGWMLRVRLSDPAQLGQLLDPAAYEALTAEG